MRSGIPQEKVSSSSELPFELLLEVLECALGDKATLRAAACLAQTCRALRTSEVGKQARYALTLCLLSISAPKKLPADLDYEIQVLQTSAWPRPPRVKYTRLGASESVTAACLRGSEYFAISLDRRRLLCYTSEARIEATQQPSSPSTLQLETTVLRKAILLPEEVAFFAVDEEADFCAIVYGEADDEDITANADSPQSIEVRCLRTGEPAVPGPLTVDVTNRRISAIEILGDFLLLKFIHVSDGFEVRRWKVSPGNAPPCPVVYSRGPGEGEIECGTSLFPPNYLSIQTRRSNWGNAGDGAQMHIYQLNHSFARLIATFKFPDYDGRLLQSYLTCGAKVEPGENSVCFITTSGSFVSQRCEAQSVCH